MTLLAVIAVGLFDSFSVYSEVTRRVYSLQAIRLEAARSRIEENVRRVKGVSAEVFSLPMSSPLLPVNTARDELRRLLKVLPEVESAAYGDGQTTALAKVARSGSDDDVFPELSAEMVRSWVRQAEWTHGPIYLVGGYRPHIDLCFCPQNQKPYGVVRIDLKFVGEAVERGGGQADFIEKRTDAGSGSGTACNGVHAERFGE